VVSKDKKHTLMKGRERSSCLCRACCGDRRSFRMAMETEGKDEDRSPVFEMDRPWHCRWFCFPCSFCTQVINVYSHGRPLGHVRERCWICTPHLNVWDERDTLRYTMVGENMCCRCSLCSGACCWCIKCCPDFTFSIRDGVSGHEEGTVTKKFSGVGKELFTNADNYKMKFPPNASPNDRALLVSASVLIDYLYFEREVITEPGDDD